MSKLPLFSGLFGSPYSLAPGGTGPIDIEAPVADFVYRPGGTQSGNVYTSFADLITAAQAVEGRALLRVDTSVTNPATVPAGTYDMEGITVAGDPDAPTPTVLQLAEGVAWTQFRHATDNVQINFAGSTPPCSDIANGEVVVLDNRASLSCSGSGTFFNLSGLSSGQRASFYIRDGSYFNDDTGPIIHAPTSGSEFETFVVSGGSVEGDTISGVAGSTWRRTIVDGGTYNLVQPDFLGTVVDTGGFLTPEQHRTVRQLIHFIDNGPAEGFVTGAHRVTLPAADPLPTSITWWTSVAQTAKIVQKDLTYSGALPSTIQWRMYDVDGVTVLATVTDTLAYSGAFETSRTRTIA